MNTLHSHRLIKNGIFAMLLAMLAGFMLIFSMIGAISFSPLPLIDASIPGTPQGWRMVHLGMIMNGLMAILLGLCMRWLVVTARGAAIVSWGTITAIWGNSAFYLFGMFAPNHGVTLQSNRLGEANLAGAIAFLPALVGVVTLLAALIVLFRASARE